MPSNDSMAMPTVQVPVEQLAAESPAWNVAPLAEPSVDMTASPIFGEPVTEYLQTQEYAPANEYPAGESYQMVPPPMYAQAPGVFRVARRPRVRKVSRVVRAVDAWSVFKISIVFYLAMYVVCLVAGVLLWNVAYSTGTIDNISSFFESFGWKSFQFKGGEIFHNAWIIGLFLVVGLTGLNVVLATLFNLITDLVGGIRVTVLDEEVLVRRVGAAGQIDDGATSPIAPKRYNLDRWKKRRPRH